MLTVKPQTRQNLAHGRKRSQGGQNKARLQGTFIGLLGSTIVRVVYSDESGVGDNSEPITVVTAIILNMDNQWEPIRDALTDIRARMPRKLLNWKYGSPGEIKGNLLFKGLRGKLGKTFDRTIAGERLAEILAIVPKHHIHVFHGAIDRAGRKNFVGNFELAKFQQSESQAAFHECLQRLEDFVYGFLPKEKILWIADHSGFENEIKHGLNVHRVIEVMDLAEFLKEHNSKKREEDRKQGLGMMIKLLNDPEAASPIFDTIYFGHSHESLALQLADVCCSAITQHLLGQKDGTAFYQIIKPLTKTDGQKVIFSPAWGGRNVQ
jgi:hypothetical protein